MPLARLYRSSTHHKIHVPARRLPKATRYLKGLAEAAGFDPDDMIRNPESYFKEGDDGHRLNKTVQSDARWERGEIAFFEARFFAPNLREWLRAIGAPLAETNAALIEAAPDPNPKEEFWVKLTPFEELDDDA
jgi:hypothetical protein